jgi:hypothetical protein
VRALIVFITVVAASPAFAQDRVIGLLALPTIFSEGPCKPFEARPVPIYAAADKAQSIATIEVDQMWSMAPHGGCEGLEVSIHQGKTTRELPTREYDYEAPAAIVLDQQGSMFKIRLGEQQAGWVQSAPARFMSYESLMEEFTGVTYFTAAFDGALRAAPGATVANQPTARAKPGLPARVIETRRIGSQLWFHVEVLNHSMCDAAASGPPETIANGWLAAHGDDGEPTVWFASRGC